MTQPLKMRAEDAEDLAVIASLIQDALVPFDQMAFTPKARRFALVMSRFMWEAAAATGGGDADHKGPYRRVMSGLHFEHVLSVQARNMPAPGSAGYLDLLTIKVEPGAQTEAVLTLVFAGEAAVRLEVECIEGRLSDIGEPRETDRIPHHSLESAAESI
jgi:hypothetical protein